MTIQAPRASPLPSLCGDHPSLIKYRHFIKSPTILRRRSNSSLFLEFGNSARRTVRRAVSSGAHRPHCFFFFPLRERVRVSFRKGEAGFSEVAVISSPAPARTRIASITFITVAACQRELGYPRYLVGSLLTWPGLSNPMGVGEATYLLQMLRTQVQVGIRSLHRSPSPVG